jgi:hypothetical protein
MIVPLRHRPHHDPRETVITPDEGWRDLPTPETVPAVTSATKLLLAPDAFMATEI